MRLTLLLCCLPGLLAAQSTDTAAVHGLPVTDSVLRLPIDRPSDALPWMAGGGLDPDGIPNWRGTNAQLLDRVTDGVRWATGLRSRGSTGLGPVPVILEPGLNAIGGAQLRSLARGPASLVFATNGGGERWRSAGTAESDAPMRMDGGAGRSRFEAAVGGPLFGAFRLRASGTLTGLQSTPSGQGYAGAPYYVPSAIDTTMRVADPSSLPDSVDVGIQRFRSTSSVPYSPSTSADWALRLDGRLGPVSIWSHWLGTRETDRFFDYLNVSDPLQTFGQNSSGRDLAAGALLPLASTIRLEATISLQHERSERGPLASTSEIDSRDPSLGLMLGGVDLRWDMDNFPIDDQLISNYRSNAPGSRRSPYDLENTAQYALIDQYRNNAYGLLGWSESGGPIGTLAFYQDTRALVQAAVDWDLGPQGRLRFSAEQVRHDAQNYMHGLVTQANSDVWKERPVEAALSADWSRTRSGWTIDLGARLDQFKTGADRTFLLDTFSGSPTVGQYVYFPRISSYGLGSDSLQKLVPEARHTAIAPHLALTGALEDGTTVRVSVARSARMPDLAYLLRGLNTDVAITNANSSFGTDMGHEVIDVYEVGLAKRFGGVELGATAFDDRLTRVVVTSVHSLEDPARNMASDVRLARLANGGSFGGLSLTGDWRTTAWLQVQGTYTIASQSDPAGVLSSPTFTSDAIRPQTVALRARLEAPATSTLRGFGAVVSYRLMTGAARIADTGSVAFNATRSDGLPAWSSLDLRVAKSLQTRLTTLTIYLDGRNLLSAQDLRRAFGGGTPSRSADLEALRWSNDSSNYANEALRGGYYDAGNGNIDLTFGGAGRGGCGAWVSATGASSPPNCAYLIAAEQLFGDGDGIYSLTEQRAASLAYYRTSFGTSAFTAPGRAVRLGAQISF